MFIICKDKLKIEYKIFVSNVDNLQLYNLRGVHARWYPWSGGRSGRSIRLVILRRLVGPEAWLFPTSVVSVQYCEVDSAIPLVESVIVVVDIPCVLSSSFCSLDGAQSKVMSQVNDPSRWTPPLVWNSRCFTNRLVEWCNVSFF